MRRDFFERLNECVIICDGAMGTMLYEKGVPKGQCYDELNIKNPEIVKEIHYEYIKAGAEIIETNTFGANPYILEKYYALGNKARDINYYGAKIAREVAGDKFVAGAIGPITRPIEEYKKLSKDEIKEIVKIQIESLIEGGVDIILFETFTSLEELIQSYLIAKEICDLPIICQMTFTKGKTLTGEDPTNVAIKLDEIGVKIIGANCGTGPSEIYEVIQRMGKVTNCMLSAQPNAGLPTFIDRKYIYPATPEYFGIYAKKFLSSGVNIIGGCCGTTPAHIKAIKDAVDNLKPKKRSIIKINNIFEQKVKRVQKNQTLLSEKLGKKFIISVEIEPPRGIDFSNELFWVEEFKKLGVDCINITDNPMATPRMSGISLSYLLKDKIEIILHYVCRDKNLLAIQADLLGLEAVGIRNILALTGDPPIVGDYPFASAVYDITSDGLIEILNKLNQGIDWLGKPIDKPTSFFIGVGSRLDDIERTKMKVSKGIDFIQTQAVFDINIFNKFKKHFNLPVIASIFILSSVRQAEFIKNEVPGVFMPDEIIERMRKGVSGVEIAKEIFNEIKNICEGVCIVPFGKYELINKVLS